ncbi:MAG: LytR/AlgR family response regulator transcription factor [Kofleriaceae bacterium]
MTAIAILEDEALARERLESALRRVEPGISIAPPLASVAHAVEWLAANPVDLVLADIQLADGLSFEVFERVALTCPVVFVTAYDEYAIEAMTAGGIDYLLKPIKDEDLVRALGRYRRLEAHFADRVRVVAATLSRSASRPRRLLARAKDAFVTIALDEIAYFFVDDKDVEVFTRDGRRAGIDRPLAELEAELVACELFRVNRQFLVAASAVCGFKPFVKGKLLVELQPAAPTDVVVSADNAVRFKSWIGG